MDKMREEFEAWYGEQFKYSDKKLTRHGETYLSPFVGGLWSAWKASRAALCVELPYDETYEVEDDFDVGYFEAVSFYNQQLENLGVTLK